MLQMPLLNLDLDVRENGEIKPISIEMNKEELQNLINALEAANKVVLQLKWWNSDHQQYLLVMAPQIIWGKNVFTAKQKVLVL